MEPVPRNSKPSFGQGSASNDLRENHHYYNENNKNDNDDSRDVDVFYEGVIEDLRMRGLPEMAEELLRIRHQGNDGASINSNLDAKVEKARLQREGPSSSATAPAAAPPALENTPTRNDYHGTDSNLEQQKSSPSGSEETARVDDETDEAKNAPVATQRQQDLERSTSRSSIDDAPEPTVLVRNDGTGQGISLPGAFNVTSQSWPDYQGDRIPPANLTSLDHDQEELPPVPRQEGDHSTNSVASHTPDGNASAELQHTGDDNDNSHTLEAVRVDDIMTVKAEPLNEAALKRRLLLKALAFFVVTITFVLAISLTLQGRDDDKSDASSTLAPTIGSEKRFPLLREFFIDSFSPLYTTESDAGSNSSSGRLVLQDIFNDSESAQYRALEWLAFQDPEVESSIRLDSLLLREDQAEESNKDSSIRSANLFHKKSAHALLTDEEERLIQRYALAVLFYTTKGPSLWIDQFEFLSWGHECNWSGALQCTEEGDHRHITHIDLQENGLEGSIPFELASLIHLRSIIVSFNELTRTLPLAIASLTALREFDVAHNSFSGTIPEEYYTQWLQLETLKVGENQFTGTISPLIGNLELLRHFGAERLYWEGTVPRKLFQRLTNLEFLEFSNQNIGFVNDTLATEIGLWSNLQTLAYHGVELRGTIPTEIGLLAHLSRLQLNSNHLTGAIPSEMGLLTAMTRLAMSVNGLTGTLPKEFAYMTELTRFELQNTFLTGDIGFLCEAIDDGLMKEIHPLQFDLEEVSGCSCCTCCMY